MTSNYLKEGLENFNNKTSIPMPDVEIEKPLTDEMENKLSCFPRAEKEFDKLHFDNLMSRQTKLSATPPSSKIKDFWYSNKVVNWFFGRSLAMSPSERVIVMYDKLRQSGMSAEKAGWIAPKEVFIERGFSKEYQDYRTTAKRELTDKELLTLSNVKMKIQGEGMLDALMFFPMGSLKKAGLEMTTKVAGKVGVDKLIKSVFDQAGKKIVGAPIREIKEEVIEKVVSKVGKGIKMAEPKIKATGHILAKKLGLKDKAYKELAEAATGKTSMKEMTATQADHFVKVMTEKLSKVSAKVPEMELGFYDKFIAPWHRTLSRIGAKDIYNRIDDATTILYKDRDNFKALYRTLFQSVKKGGKTDKVGGQLLRNFASPEDILRAPNSIKVGGKNYLVSQQEKELSSNVRKIYDSFFQKINEVLVSYGEKPILYRRKYLTKVLDDVGRLLLKKDQFQRGWIDTLRYVIPTKMRFPYGLSRVSVLEPTTPSLITALEKYTNSALRTINYTPALKETSSLIKKLPASSSEYAKSWIGNTILGRPNGIDKAINKTFEGIVNTMSKIPLVEKVIKPVGYSTKATRVLNQLRNLSYSGTMGLNIPLAVRNLTQGFLTFGELGAKYTTIGYKGITTKAGRKFITENCDLLKGRVPMLEMMPEGWWTSRTQDLMFFYRKADAINVSSAFYGAYQRAIKKGISKVEAIGEANEIAKMLQFSYRSIDLPSFMSAAGIFGKYAGQFKTWPINYFELLRYWASQGKVGYWKITRYLMSTSGFVYGMNKMFDIDYTRIMPNKVLNPLGRGNVFSLGSPVIGLLRDLGKLTDGLKTENERQINEASRSLILYDIPACFIPTGVMTRKVIQVGAEEAEFKSLFFPVKYKTPAEKREEIQKQKGGIMLP